MSLRDMRYTYSVWCWFGWHQWSPWGAPRRNRPYGADFRFRVCSQCGKRQAEIMDI